MDNTLEIAQNILGNRCRYCGTEPGTYHHKHCNVVLSAKIDTLVQTLAYKIEKIARDLEIVTYDVRSLLSDLEMQSQTMIFTGQDNT